MTKGGPPWQIYGPGTQEPDDAVGIPNAGKDSGAGARLPDLDTAEPAVASPARSATATVSPAKTTEDAPSAPAAVITGTVIAGTPGAGSGQGGPPDAGDAQPESAPDAAGVQAGSPSTGAPDSGATSASAADGEPEPGSPEATPAGATLSAEAPGSGSADAALAAGSAPYGDSAPDGETEPESPAGGRGQVSPPPRVPAPGLSTRLTALARLVQIGESRTVEGFSEDLLENAELLLDRAGERLRLSAGHTVVALAGGTGSGKSSLFNRLAGADLSPVGVTRPVTRYPHACAWGAEGSGPLLEWLGVPRRFRYTRGSALDGGESSLNGLVLLDLPDHDSVATGPSSQVDKLVGMADVVVWVLDPQKYADGAVHRKYLVPLAGHSEVIAIVLNQSDLLSAAETEDCVGDLRRLLDSEGLHDVQVLVTSAKTGAGVEQLRTLLADSVTERRAATARISADVDAIATKFAVYARERPDAADGQGDIGLPPGSGADLVDAFSRAAGVSAVGDAVASAHELRAVDFIGWPVTWPVERMTGRDPIRRARLGRLWEEVKGMTAGPSGAQQAEIDGALTRLADEVSQPLPRPWSQTTRSAVRSRAEQIPAALATSVSRSVPAEDRIAPWWRLIGALQGVLLAGAFLSLLWIGALLTFGVFHVIGNVPWLLSDAHLLPWGIILIAAFLLLGWVIASGCMNLVRTGVQRDRERMQDTMRTGIGDVANGMVILPVEQELAEYRRFRDELAVAAGL
jgi:GTP-binding protein EngB required for normal cell division